MSIVNEIRQQQKQNKSYRIARYKKCWSSGESPYVYVTIKTEDGKTLNNSSKHKLLDSYAKRWGSIHSRKTEYNDKGLTIKHYTCSGHGGYLVITDKPIPEKEASLSPSSYPDNALDNVEFYLYEFEEDCGWSQLLISLPEKIQNKVLNSWSEDLIEEKPNSELLKSAEETADKWDLQALNLQAVLQ